MKMKKRIIAILMSMLPLLVTCLFFGQKVQAKEQVSANYNVVSVTHLNGATTGSTEYKIPDDIKEPVEKGKALVIYITISLGVIFFLVGAILCGIAWVGHQPDQKLNGIIFMGVGVFIGVSAAIAAWLIPGV